MSKLQLFYVNYDSGDLKDIEFTDFQVGDSIIICLRDSEFKKALNNTAVAEQVQLGTQRMNDSETQYYDYLLSDGTMVKQYEYNGTISYTLFRCLPSGETVEISTLITRDENSGYRWGELSPLYEIDGKKVDEKEFNEKLNELIINKIIDEQS